MALPGVTVLYGQVSFEPERRVADRCLCAVSNCVDTVQCHSAVLEPSATSLLKAGG